MRGRLASILTVAAATAAAACGLVAGLEPPVDDTNAGIEAGGEATVPDAGDGGAATWCDRQTDDVDGGRGALIYCNDFDRDLPKLGFNEIRSYTGITMARDPWASSPPSSFAVTLEPDPGKPLFFGSQPITVSSESLSLMMDVSFGPDGGFDAAATDSAVTLAVISFESQNVVAIGVLQGQFVVAFVDNLIDIDVGDIAARGQRLGLTFKPGYAFETIELRIARLAASPCEQNATKYVGPPVMDPDGGDAGQDAGGPGVYVLAYASGVGTAIRCALLPEVTPGAAWTLLLGGFIQQPKDHYEWRFDNVAVRSMR